MSQAEVRALRAEISALRLVVEALEERVRGLEEDRGCRVEGSEAERSSGWTEVTEERSVGYQETQVVGTGSATGPIRTEDTEGRLDLAKSCGRFLLRALSGDYRQSSGRDRLRLASKVYVVLATYSGERCIPPKIIFNFAEVKQLCKSGPHCGKSVFLGFASQWEARAALQEAGYTWPLSA